MYVHYLKGIGTFHYAIKHHSPTKEEQGGRGYPRGFEEGNEPHNKHKRGHEPKIKAQFRELNHAGQGYILPHGTEDKNGTEDVNHPINHKVGKRSQGNAQHKAANTNHGERGFV